MCKYVLWAYDFYTCSSPYTYSAHTGKGFIYLFHRSTPWNCPVQWTFHGRFFASLFLRQLFYLTCVMFPFQKSCRKCAKSYFLFPQIHPDLFKSLCVTFAWHFCLAFPAPPPPFPPSRSTTTYNNNTACEEEEEEAFTYELVSGVIKALEMSWHLTFEKRHSAHILFTDSPKKQFSLMLRRLILNVKYHDISGVLMHIKLVLWM